MKPRAYPILITCSLVLMAITLVWMLAYGISQHLSPWLISAVSIWSALAIIFLGFAYRSTCVGYLLAFFAVIVVLRSLGVNSYFILLIPSVIAFFMMAALFFIIASEDIKSKTLLRSCYEWQLVFVRLYIGFDLIAHCSEKLFAGPAPFHQDILAFIHLQIPHPEFFVTIAGLCEFAGAIAIGLGFFTRIGAIGIALYVFVATILGHHFSLGFIWANPGGGWEFPMMWTILLLSFAVFGANSFSIDGALARRYQLPAWIKWLMG